MRQLETKPFPYYVGIYSLEELVTKKSRVCVINILGSESRKVTPVSHVYSGGNVVAGVQYGRRGFLETPIGNIPVYRSVRDVKKQGITFDIGVIYLPPMAVSQAVWELASHNKDLKRVVIVTEKVSTRDSMNVRFICQDAGVDAIGANCLGMANVWDHVRVGGALGGDNPDETLKKGSIAIYSNSGNFTTTIAEYLRTAGFGISTAVSSGKDIYIHFALPEFLYAAQNDPRTKAVALYIEPGGYYEKQALEWISERRFSYNKSMVVCVTGRWKKNLNRPCGHAGAMAGSGDDAESKEMWFDQYFGMDVFDPKKPKVSKKGIRVTSIQHIPAAMHAVFQKLDEAPDFESSGDLHLKPWISDTILVLPRELDIPVMKATAPYDQQIKEINKQVGANYLRRNMRNASGASRIKLETQVSELHGRSVLDLAKTPFEENVYFALAKVVPEKADLKIINMLLNLSLQVDEVSLQVIDRAKANRCTPNAYLASQVAAIGENEYLNRIREISQFLINLIREFTFGEEISSPKEMDALIIERLMSQDPVQTDEIFDILLKEVSIKNRHSPVLDTAQHILELAATKKRHLQHPEEFLIAVLLVSIFWKPMLEKRMSRATAENAFTYIYIISKLVTFSVIDRNSNAFWKKLASSRGSLNTSFTENIFKILFNRPPDENERIELQYIIGLTITNGPGTLSAKGAKESVSARNAISTAFTGFLTNTGLAHGGNGFEAVEYLVNTFKDVDLKNPGSPDKSLDLKNLANKAAKSYLKYKQDSRDAGQIDFQRIPCIGHPVFKGNDVNIDPREDFIRKELKERNIGNVFLEYYHHLVNELFYEGVTRNIFCVNVDAVLAVITLKLIWNDLKSNKLTLGQVQDLSFILFILGRSIGTAAEIADHRDRGEDMDCRTPQGEIAYIL